MLKNISKVRIKCVKQMIITLEVILMSTKELLYLEDALAHEQQLKTKCQDYAPKMQDADLKAFVEQLVTKHDELFGQFYQVL